MQIFSESELIMWNTTTSKSQHSINIEEINEKYVRGEQRIVTEMNREKLPNFVDALSKKDYMELKPFYQRRLRWDSGRQSKLIESFIINIPVPPVFLYEKAFNSYEVMDGQQRITAIRDFYLDKFELSNLDLWPELNGLKYSDLPSKIKAGLDRRSISSIVLLKESAPDEEEAVLLRQLVFERLNTGGVKLERQEIRNSLSFGKFNDLLIKLSRFSLFRQLWNLPQYTIEEENNLNLPIYKSSFYTQMEDIEVILRFFALRHINEYKLGIQGFLDLYMAKSKNFVLKDLNLLEEIFIKTLNCSHSIYGENTFKLYEKNKWSKQPIKGIYDSVMIGLSYFPNDLNTLIERKEYILDKTIDLFKQNKSSIFTGRASTKQDLISRIKLFKDIFEWSLL